jgi:hypothetical protein
MQKFLYLIAFVLLIGGGMAILAPQEMTLAHLGRTNQLTGRMPPTSALHLSKSGAIAYGVVSFGLGLGALILARRWDSWQEEIEDEKRGSHRFNG